MNAIYIICQVFRVAIVGIFLTLNTIASVKSSKLDIDYKPEIDLQQTFNNIRTSIDSKVAENDHFPSFLSPGHTKQLNPDFSHLFPEENDKEIEIPSLKFNFDQSAYDKIKIPQRKSTEPKFLLNYKPLRPSNYIAPSFTNDPFNVPEHQDNGGDGDGGDGGDDGDGGDGGGGDGGGGGGGGGSGGGNNGGGGGGNRRGGSGNRGSGGGNRGNGGGNKGGGGGNKEDDFEDEDDGRFISHLEQDDDNIEPRNGWLPINNKVYGSDISENQFRRKPQKKFPGYGTNQVPIIDNDNFHKPYKQLSTYKQKQPHQFSDGLYSRGLVETKHPVRIYDHNDDTKPFKSYGNNKRPLRINGKNGRLSNKVRENTPTSIVDEDIEEDDPRPLQSRRSPTKKRQVCQKVKKSMTPEDIEDHEDIGKQMSCMVCKNLASGGTYEKCSYKLDPTTEDDFDDADIVPRPKTNRIKIRIKRRIIDRKKNTPDHSGEEVEDYEYDNINAQESGEYPEYTQNVEVEYDDDPENQEVAENESEEYKIPPMPLKSSTCHKVKKKGNVCNVCRDNLSNREYEQCEYEEDPQKNSYDYSTRSVYGAPRYKRQLDSDRTYDDYFKKLFPELGSNRKSSLATKFSSKDGDFGFLDNGQIGFKKTKSSLLGDKDLSIDFDMADDSPVNRMLGDFRNKDRSNCKKSLKDKMTCYKCKNDKGTETEECIYITDNNPKGRKQSYHETKKFNTLPDEEKSTDVSKSNQNSTKQQPASSMLMHVYAPLFSANYEPLQAQFSHHRPNRKNSHYRLHKRPVVEEDVEDGEEEDQAEAQSVETQNADDDDDYVDPNAQVVSRHDLPEIDPFGPEGAYSEETIPVYDPMLGTWLPRYMVLKSSDEAMVDAELGFE